MEISVNNSLPARGERGPQAIPPASGLLVAVPTAKIRALILALLAIGHLLPTHAADETLPLPPTSELLRESSSSDGPWVYEFEFGALIAGDLRLLRQSQCTKVVPIEVIDWYVIEPRAGWEISCGNREPTYNHFLGRRCWKPLPRLVFECGWRHFSSPADNHELSYDSLAIRGRFSWGR